MLKITHCINGNILSFSGDEKWVFNHDDKDIKEALEIIGNFLLENKEAETAEKINKKNQERVDAVSKLRGGSCDIILTAESHTDQLVKALREDENLFHGWQSNIAMNMYDEIREHQETRSIKESCNAGAKRFLDSLISKSNI